MSQVDSVIGPMDIYRVYSIVYSILLLLYNISINLTYKYTHIYTVFKLILCYIININIYTIHYYYVYTTPATKANSVLCTLSCAVQNSNGAAP